jgi:hypothetical protein
MILEKYTTEELASVFEGVNDKGVMAFLVLELNRISAELEEVKKNTEKKSVGRPRGSFKGEAPSKGYTPIGEVNDENPDPVVGE